jgi:hypothetical protein
MGRIRFHQGYPMTLSFVDQKPGVLLNKIIGNGDGRFYYAERYLARPSEAAWH